MNSGAASKDALRQLARSRRRALSLPQRRSATRRVIHGLLTSEFVRRSRVIAIYASVASELPTDALVDQLMEKGKQLLMPSVVNEAEHRMEMLRYGPGISLKTGAFGIRSPYPAIRSRTSIDLVLLPIVAFDALGNRLGSGAGYYDRWLARQNPRPTCVGLAFAAQEVDCIPVEPTDQPLDAICTENGIRRFRQQTRSITGSSNA